MDFLDLRVHSLNSSGTDSYNSMLMQAKALGAEIGLCDNHSYDEGIYSGIEIKENTKKKLKKSIDKNLSGFDYILVHGGNAEINRYAVMDRRVGILAHPDKGRKDSGLDAFLARQAAINGVAIEMSISGLLNSRRNERVKRLRNLHANLMLKRKYGFDIIVTSGAKSRYDLRTPEEVAALLEVIGFTREEIVDAMVKVPMKIITRTRESKQSLPQGVVLVED